MILLIDNYDSFVFNLARYLTELGRDTLVLRNDAIQPEDLAEINPEAIVLSPGPCGPAEAGICVELVRQWRGRIPILGICLGHQCIAAAGGGRIVRAPEPVHGRVSVIHHEQTPLFDRVASPFRATRYHSLVVDEASLPADLLVTARSEDGLPMALEVVGQPLWGLQFHPEAILTENGHRLLANFLRLSNLPVGKIPESELAPSEFPSAGTSLPVESVPPPPGHRPVHW